MWSLHIANLLKLQDVLQIKTYLQDHLANLFKFARLSCKIVIICKTSCKFNQICKKIHVEAPHMEAPHVEAPHIWSTKVAQNANLRNYGWSKCNFVQPWLRKFALLSLVLLELSQIGALNAELRRFENCPSKLFLF